jgi:hypothetical protein
VTFVIGVFFCLMIAILTALAERRNSRPSVRKRRSDDPALDHGSGRLQIGSRPEIDAPEAIMLAVPVRGAVVLSVPMKPWQPAIAGKGKREWKRGDLPAASRR